MDKLSQNSKIAVIGGDERQLYCAKELSEYGFETAVFGFDKIVDDIGNCTKCVTLDDALKKAQLVILPLPVSRDNNSLFMPLSENYISIEALFSILDKDTAVFCGNASEQVRRAALKHGLKVVDYYDREELKIANAYLTAESAVSIAMNETDFSVRDNPVLVLGYGRIGKALCHLLKGMGVDVYASARKHSDIEWIRTFGYSAVDTSKVKDVLSHCKIIFNTIPHRVLGEESFKYIQNDSVIIDLASSPGGVDFAAAKSKGLRVIWALALPGKKLKKSAGNVIAKTIISILEDEEMIE